MACLVTLGPLFGPSPEAEPGSQEWPASSRAGECAPSWAWGSESGALPVSVMQVSDSPVDSQGCLSGKAMVGVPWHGPGSTAL